LQYDMINDTTRDLLKEVRDTEHSPNTDLLYFPDHLTCYEELGRRMNRQAHQLINLARSNVPMHPKPKLKTELKKFAPEVIKSAVVSTTIDAEDINVVVMDEFLDPLLHRAELTDKTKVVALLSTLPSNDDSDAVEKLGLGEVTSLRELVHWYNKDGNVNEDNMTTVMFLGNRYTQLVNMYISATVSAELVIPSFFDEYLGLLAWLEDNGFDEAERFMDSMTIYHDPAGPIPKTLEKCIILYVDKTSDEMGFSQLTNEMFVTLSRVYHPTLLDLVHKCYMYAEKIPRITLLLKDDTFTMFKSSIPGANWGLTRAA
jgi:hypothetical protein